MPAGHPRRGKSPRDTPARMLHCKCAGVDAVVGLAGQRVVNLDQIVPAQQPRGLHHAALVPVVASRDINGRSAAHDRGTAGLDVHRPAVHRELRDIALDDSHQPGRVAERRAHPVAPAAHAAAADIERDLRPPDGTRPLQGGVREFGASEFHREDALRKRHEDLGAAGHIDERAGVEVDLSAGKEEALAGARGKIVQPGFLRAVREQRRTVAIGIRIRPCARAHRDVRARREDRRILPEMNRETFNIDLRILRQRRARHGLSVRVVGEDACDAGAAECDRAGVLKKERRPAGCAGAGVVVVRISDRAIARDEINAPIEAHACRAVRDAILVHRASGDRDGSRRCGNDAAVRRGPRVGRDAAHPHVNSAQARVVRCMGRDRDLIARGEDGLPAGRRNRAIVGDLRPDEHHAPAIAVAALRAADLRALL